ncbi:hypothetical protein H257_18839 [Aphanomyces astaci]|uniref:DDE Tnp4 domain-containing protein n=1 Tax=Aphanomyces astaci TaxID=112090 RepID=W4FBF1_APHAT|nr:hypothetical protein H257_18839 [Aphanomyces astaci]ETV64244.1 hypothetical protein H257_18839 [Aphanomyces astaci]|eukprot:XP_009846273.1 hypothetical protein H257_18839 [Aphanomyces astaci]
MVSFKGRTASTTSIPFVKTISKEQGRNATANTKAQEPARKDVERIFGALKARFHIMDCPCRLWRHATIVSVWVACVIMHNMIVENALEHVEPCDQDCGHFKVDTTTTDEDDSRFDRFLRMKKTTEA